MPFSYSYSLRWCLADSRCFFKSCIWGLNSLSHKTHQARSWLYGDLLNQLANSGNDSHAGLYFLAGRLYFGFSAFVIFPLWTEESGDAIVNKITSALQCGYLRQIATVAKIATSLKTVSQCQSSHNFCILKTKIFKETSLGAKNSPKSPKTKKIR